MRNLYLLLLLPVFISACNRSNIIKTTEEGQNINTKTSEIISSTLSLTAQNLSEDFNRLSTQDDELILLVYTLDPTDQLPTLVFQEYFILDSTQWVKEIILADSVLQKQEIALVLIEMDSDMGLQQVEPMVRLNLETILAFDQVKKPEGLQSLLGDDDLLGATKLKITDLQSQSKEIEFKGRRLFDSYWYVVAFGK